MATRVLIAGGGVAALEAALALRELGEGRVSVEMLAPEPQFWYRPLAVAEPFDLGEVRQFELTELAEAAGATFSLGALAGIEAGGRLAHTSAGGSVPYDVLLVACGASPIAAVPGALTFRGPVDTERIRTLLQEIVIGRVERVAFGVPWGAVWALPIYELALMTAAYLAERGLDHVELTLVTPESEPLQLFGREIGRRRRVAPAKTDRGPVRGGQLDADEGDMFHAVVVPDEQHRVGSELAMNDPVVMKRLECLADLAGDAQRGRRIERTACIEDFTECGALGALECDEQRAGLRRAAFVHPR